MSQPPTEPTSAQIAAYIEDMLAELADLASTHGFKTLATSLRMTAVDAARLASACPNGD